MTSYFPPGLIPKYKLLEPESVLNLAQAVFAEFIGVFFFLFVISMSAVAQNAFTQNVADPPVTGIIQYIVFAVTHGVALTVMVAMTAKISGGHLNPAVTLSFLVTGELAVVKSLLYIVAQFAGALAGSGVAAALTPSILHGTLSTTQLGDLQVVKMISINGTSVPELERVEISLARGFLLEFLGTCILICVVWSTAATAKGHNLGKLAPLPIGFAVLVDVAILAWATGASMNPARSLGPAVVSGTYKDLWLYLLAPTVAGLVVGVVYRLILFDRLSAAVKAKEEANEQAATEYSPLNASTMPYSRDD